MGSFAEWKSSMSIPADSNASRLFIRSSICVANDFGIMSCKLAFINIYFDLSKAGSRFGFYVFITINSGTSAGAFTTIGISSVRSA